MLTGKQKRFLRAMGNEMEPILLVGKGGISDNLLIQAQDTLEARELIKGRVLPNSLEAPKEIAEALAAKVEGELVQVVGRNFLIYRASERKPVIVLPE